MQAIVQGFTGLLRFGGRDRRSRFWPYAAVIFVVMFMAIGIGCAIAMQPVIAEAEAYAREHPESVTVRSSPTSYHVEYAPGSDFMPDVSGFFQVLAVGVGVTVLLLAAAVTRRLHDRGLPGFVGLAPVVFLGLGLFGFTRLMEAVNAGEEPFGLFFLMFGNNLLYLASLAGLIILLCLPGKPQANRYGPPPAP